MAINKKRIEDLNRMYALAEGIVQKKGFPRKYTGMVKIAQEHIEKARTYLLAGEDEACITNVLVARDFLMDVYEKTKNEVERGCMLTSVIVSSTSHPNRKRSSRRWPECTGPVSARISHAVVMGCVIPWSSTPGMI